MASDGIALEGAPQTSYRQTALIGWAIANSVSLSITLAIPLWMPDFAERVGLPAFSAGIAATTELAAAAAANILWSLFGPRHTRPLFAAALALTIAAASQMAASSSALAAFSGLILAGACAGCLLAVLNKQVAASPSSQRIYAALTFLHVCFGVFFYLTAPRVQHHFGGEAIFQLLSALAVLGAPFMAFLPRASEAVSDVAAGTVSHPSFHTMLALVALGGLLMGHEAVIAHVAPLGRLLGLERAAIGHMLALASAVGLTGAFTAGLLPLKAGYALPICAALSGVALLDLSLVRQDHPAGFVATIVALQTLVVFTAPRILGYLARLDQSGRSAGMGPAAILIGTSLGPLLGSFADTAEHVRRVPGAAACVILGSLLLIAIVGFTQRRLRE